MFRRLIFAGVLAGMGAAAASAQGTQVAFGAVRGDPSAPVEVTADALDVNQENGSALFKGNVKIGQGEMRLSANTVLVIYSDGGGGIQRLEAVGDVVLVSGPDAAQAARADYSVSTGVVVMTGDVLLTQGANALTSDKMTVNLSDGTARMVGSVKTILVPDSGD